MNQIKVTIKQVYGRELVYPSCETSKKFADLLNVKSFNPPQLKAIEGIGFQINYVTGEATAPRGWEIIDTATN